MVHTSITRDASGAVSRAARRSRPGAGSRSTQQWSYPCGGGELLVREGEALAQDARFPEVERGAAHLGRVALRDALGVHGEVVVGVDLQGVAEDVGVVAEVEVGVLGEVDDRRPVGGGRAVERKGARGVEGVRGADVQGSGEAHVAVGAVQAQGDGGGGVTLLGGGRPDSRVEALGTAVQRVARSLRGIRWVVPSSVKLPCAIRLA